MSNPFYKELVLPQHSPENLGDDRKILFFDDFREVFADHLYMNQRLQKTLYRGNIEDLNEGNDQPPIALTELAFKLFTKAVPNYGLDLLDMDYVSSVSKSTKVSPCAMILALIYLERLKLSNCAYLESESPSGLFVVTMLVASKFLFEDEDDAVTNQIWAKLLNIDINELNLLEQKFLAAIDWKLYVDTSDYFQYLSGLEKMIALKQSSLRGWLSYSDAYSILHDVTVMRCLISCIKRIVKISVISALGYAVTTLSVFTAGHSLQSLYSKTALKENNLLNSDSLLQKDMSEDPHLFLLPELSLTDKTTKVECIISDLSINKYLSHKNLRTERKNSMILPLNLHRLSDLVYGDIKQASSNKLYKVPKGQSVLNFSLSCTKSSICATYSVYAVNRACNYKKKGFLC